MSTKTATKGGGGAGKKVAGKENKTAAAPSKKGENGHHVSNAPIDTITPGLAVTGGISWAEKARQRPATPPPQQPHQIVHVQEAKPEIDEVAAHNKDHGGKGGGSFHKKDQQDRNAAPVSKSNGANHRDNKEYHQDGGYYGQGKQQGSGQRTISPGAQHNAPAYRGGNKDGGMAEYYYDNVKKQRAEEQKPPQAAQPPKPETHQPPKELPKLEGNSPLKIASGNPWGDKSKLEHLKHGEQQAQQQHELPKSEEHRSKRNKGKNHHDLQQEVDAHPAPGLSSEELSPSNRHDSNSNIISPSVESSQLNHDENQPPVVTETVPELPPDNMMDTQPLGMPTTTQESHSNATRSHPTSASSTPNKHHQRRQNQQHHQPPPQQAAPHHQPWSQIVDEMPPVETAAQAVLHQPLGFAGDNFSHFSGGAMSHDHDTFLSGTPNQESRQHTDPSPSQSTPAASPNFLQRKEEELRSFELQLQNRELQLNQQEHRHREERADLNRQRAQIEEDIRVLQTSKKENAEESKQLQKFKADLQLQRQQMGQERNDLDQMRNSLQQQQAAQQQTTTTSGGEQPGPTHQAMTTYPQPQHHVPSQRRGPGPAPTNGSRAQHQPQPQYQQAPPPQQYPPQPQYYEQPVYEEDPYAAAYEQQAYEEEYAAWYQGWAQREQYPPQQPPPQQPWPSAQRQAIPRNPPPQRMANPTVIVGSRPGAPPLHRPPPPPRQQAAYSSQRQMAPQPQWAPQGGPGLHEYPQPQWH